MGLWDKFNNFKDKINAVETNIYTSRKDFMEVYEKNLQLEAEIKERTRHLIEERISKKKKPLKYQENILEGKSKKQYDGDFYEINEKIINLRKPLLTDKAKEMIDEARYNAIDPEGRSLANMAAYMREDDITELLADRKFASFFIEFNALANREKKRFETLQQH